MQKKIKGIIATRQIFIDGKEILPGPSQKVYNHSPDGFMWGYGGSGPAQLALAILLEVTSKAEALHYYQDFKWQIVSKWPQDDFEDTIDIEAWIMAQ